MPSTTISPLRDCSSLLGDADALRGQIRDEGYLFLPGLLDRRPLEVFLEHALDVLVEHGWLGSKDPRDMVLPPKTTGPRVPGEDPGYLAARDHDTFHRLAFEPALVGLMDRLIGEDLLIHPAKVLRLVYPAELVPFHNGRNEHNDFGVLKTQDVFTAWVPFTECPVELGPLAVKPGTHLDPQPDHRGSVDDFDGWATSAMSPGDVLIHHCLTTHAALPNEGEGLRISGEFRFQPASEPVPAWLVCDQRDGSELYARRWEGASWWRPMPDTVQIRDVARNANPPPPPSRFLPVA